MHEEEGRDWKCKEKCNATTTVTYNTTKNKKYLFEWIFSLDLDLFLSRRRCIGERDLERRFSLERDLRNFWRSRSLILSRSLSRPRRTGLRDLERDFDFDLRYVLNG